MTVQTMRCIYMHIQYTIGVFLQPILFFFSQLEIFICNVYI